MITSYTRTPHILITISGQVTEIKNVITAYIKFMYGVLKSFPSEQTNGEVPGIHFLCLDEFHIRNGSVTITVDGKLEAVTTSHPSLIDERIKYINSKITGICKSLDVKFVNKETYTTDGFLIEMIDGSIPKRGRTIASLLGRFFSSKVPDRKYHSNDIIVRHSIQSPLTRFHIKSTHDDHSLLVLKRGTRISSLEIAVLGSHKHKK
jgi:hypothetical protein